MRAPPKLTLPGLLALIAIALVLAYFERDGDQSGDRQSARPSAPTEQRSNADAGFDYYSLVLSWSPTHCASQEARSDDTQCARRDGRQYAFILHGLWPQHTRGYPENCDIGSRPFVPQSTIDSMMDIMPSKGLIIHEYRKHGTCSGLSPEGYYKASRRMFSSIAIPERFREPSTDQFLDPRDVIREFTRYNPQLDESMIAVSCAGSGNRMREVRICFSKDEKPISCGHNENQGRLCRTSRMHVPPVRVRH